MSVHIMPLSNKNLNLVFRIYTKDPDHNTAYEQRREFNAVCLVSIKPGSNVAWVHCMLGEMERDDYAEMGERLHAAHGIIEVQYERAAGYFVSMKRRSYRRWTMERQDMFELKAANFSGLSQPEV